jgi:hypothetical protein
VLFTTKSPEARRHLRKGPPSPRSVDHILPEPPPQILSSFSPEGNPQTLLPLRLLLYTKCKKTSRRATPFAKEGKVVRKDTKRPEEFAKSNAGHSRRRHRQPDSNLSAEGFSSHDRGERKLQSACQSACQSAPKSIRRVMGRMESIPILVENQERP